MNRLEPDPKDLRGKGRFGQAVSLGTNFAAGIGVLGYLGHLLDKKTGKTPLYTAAGCLLGVAWGLYEALKLALFLSKEQKKKTPDDLEKK